MRVFRLLTLGLLLLATHAIAAAPLLKPKLPTPRPGSTQKPAPAKGPSFIDGVPDTGQFLPDTTVLATVGGVPIRAREFVDSYFASYIRYRPESNIAGREQFLQNLVNKRLLGLEARRINRPLDFADRTKLREFSSDIIANVAYQRLVVDSAQVSEAEIRALYEQMRYDQHFRHILTATASEAARVRDELLAKRISWSDAVKKYSVARRDKGPAGDLGWFTRDSLTQNLAMRVFGLKPGEISEVVQDRQGFHLIQSVEHRFRPSTGAYEGLRLMLRTQLTEYKSSLRMEAVQSVLREQVGLTYDTLAVFAVARRFRDAISIDQERLGTVFEVSDEVPEFTPADTARVLARYRNGTFSIGQLVNAYAALTPLMRPNLNSPEAVMGQIDGLVLKPVVVELAKQRGIDQDPLAVGLIEGKREEILVDHLFADSISSRISVTSAERRKYFAEHAKDLHTSPTVQYARFWRTSRPAVDSVVAKLKSGADPIAMVAADSAAGRMGSSVEAQSSERNGEFHKILFEELRPGQTNVIGPDEKGNYLALHLITYDAGHAWTYAEAETPIDDMLRSTRADAALDLMLERLKKKYPVVMRRDLLERVRMADPLLD